MLKAIFFRCFDVNALKYKTTQAKQKKISIYKCYTCNVNLHDRHIKSIQYLYYILFVNVYNIFHFLCLQYKFTLQITYKGTILNFYPSTTTKNKQYFSGTNFFVFWRNWCKLFGKEKNGWSNGNSKSSGTEFIQGCGWRS